MVPGWGQCHLRLCVECGGWAVSLFGHSLDCQLSPYFLAPRFRLPVPQAILWHHGPDPTFSGPGHLLSPPTVAFCLPEFWCCDLHPTLPSPVALRLSQSSLCSVPGAGFGGGEGGSRRRCPTVPFSWEWHASFVIKTDGQGGVGVGEVGKHAGF